MRAADFYVAVNGSDANPGTKAEPLATIQAGFNHLQPGDTLLIMAGWIAARLGMETAGYVNNRLYRWPQGKAGVSIHLKGSFEILAGTP